MVTCTLPKDARQRPQGARLSPSSGVPGAHALRARVANIALTAQVQVAYSCAQQASERARHAIAGIERSWPDTPLRALVLDIYQAQDSVAQMMARDVLRSARRNCGLAFAAV